LSLVKKNSLKKRLVGSSQAWSSLSLRIRYPD
jgi:hypothetical protein